MRNYFTKGDNQSYRHESLILNQCQTNKNRDYSLDKDYIAYYDRFPYSFNMYRRMNSDNPCQGEDLKDSHGFQETLEEKQRRIHITYLTNKYKRPSQHNYESFMDNTNQNSCFFIKERTIQPTERVKCISYKQEESTQKEQEIVKRIQSLRKSNKSLLKELQTTESLTQMLLVQKKRGEGTIDKAKSEMNKQNNNILDSSNSKNNQYRQDKQNDNQESKQMAKWLDALKQVEKLRESMKGSVKELFNVNNSSSIRANFKDMAIENKMNSSSKREKNNQSQRRQLQQGESDGSQNDSTIQQNKGKISNSGKIRQGQKRSTTAEDKQNGFMKQSVNISPSKAKITYPDEFKKDERSQTKQFGRTFSVYLKDKHDIKRTSEKQLKNMYRLLNGQHVVQ